MQIDLSGTIKTYQEAMDMMIDTLGKNIKIVFKPTIINRPDDILDPLRDDESKKPSYKTQTQEITTENYRITKALIEHDPKDYSNFGVKIEHPENIVRIKTYLTDLPDLRRCEKIITDWDINGLALLEYRLLRDPTPVGLKVQRYCISWWEQV